VWWGLRSSADGTTDGLPVVIFGGDHTALPLVETAGEVLAELVADERVPKGEGGQTRRCSSSYKASTVTVRGGVRGR